MSRAAYYRAWKKRNPHYLLVRHSCKRRIILGVKCRLDLLPKLEYDPWRELRLSEEQAQKWSGKSEIKWIAGGD